MQFHQPLTYDHKCHASRIRQMTDKIQKVENETDTQHQLKSEVS